MNTQNDFLDNAVDDGVVTDGAGDLDAEMCSYIQNDTEEMCSSLRNDTCGVCGENSKETYLGIQLMKKLILIFSCSEFPNN